jgi:hypothetical protein
MTTTTTKPLPSRVRCPDCDKAYTRKQAERLFYKNRASRTGFATWCKKHCRERDAAKKAKSAA